MDTRKHHIAVIGAGLMGHGIALTMARAGHSVSIHDPVEAARDAVKGRIAESLSLLGEHETAIETILKGIGVSETLSDCVAVATVVFEAAPEKMALKQAIFAEIEAHAPADAILASNTSVMPITEIMSKLTRRGRALGTHWWNPPHLIPLVEVIRTEWTDEPVVNAMMVLLDQAGKTPVRVAKDVPGFIGNRLQHALWREAISLVERGICDAASVDTVVKSCFGRRLAVLGPLENADLVGLDLTLDIHSQVLADLESRPGPSPLLEEMVASGRLGMKSGEGFYDWTPEEASIVKARVSSHLQRLERILPRKD
ncbi:3-hydroxyacyl-CoA dehydrogenase family protein [Rhizobium paknamense]|uniref:3-hydroxybutyryl-CoA dehydrogenase n=1 Tax=Rhizobium paknamense TaxID=1206817 RepID=A0ABU0IH23_9HYPH|nr:3-hydroxyacyl-CoA dehydrogenase NAD-binding domain-containing protein [Rhizobium paknamense]MDQ0457573.1 3-hydroxybutyryl-CoA dehydrogenase [Rhizobium paknamense]